MCGLKPAKEHQKPLTARDLARAAFTAGLNTVAAISAIIFVGLAALTLAILRRHDPAS
ncbi:hypothetical protein ACIBQ1_13640 [Nonomuraea sp. NPDC050153]|uniref:hypothetical protein n=1 Tax=Nonomuraea sp. NPDC050153 TaxID=3364359 RepID=UPI0037AD5129